MRKSIPMTMVGNCEVGFVVVSCLLLLNITSASWTHTVSTGPVLPSTCVAVGLLHASTRRLVGSALLPVFRSSSVGLFFGWSNDAGVPGPVVSDCEACTRCLSDLDIKSLPCLLLLGSLVIPPEYNARFRSSVACGNTAAVFGW